MAAMNDRWPGLRRWRCGFERAHKCPLDRSTLVAALCNLPHQHRGRYPQRLGRFLAHAQKGLVRCQFGGPKNPARIRWYAGFCQLAPYGVNRAADLFGNLFQTKTMLLK